MNGPPPAGAFHSGAAAGGAMVVHGQGPPSLHQAQAGFWCRGAFSQRRIWSATGSPNGVPALISLTKWERVESIGCI